MEGQGSEILAEEGGDGAYLLDGKTETLDRSLRIILDEETMDDDTVTSNGFGANQEPPLKSDDAASSDKTCPKWSEVLSTPSNYAAFTPAADFLSSKQNLHGIGKSFPF